MSNKTLQVARTINAFDYDDDNNPVHLHANQIENASIVNGKLVHDSVTINGQEVDLGGSINIPTSGGNVTPTNNSRISITTSPAALDVDDISGVSTHTVTVSFSVTTGYTLVQSTVSVEVRNQRNETVTTSSITFNSDNRSGSFTFTAPTDAAGTITVSIITNVTRTSDSHVYTDHNAAVIHVNIPWYWARRSSAPTAISDLGSARGTWHSPQELTPTGTGTLYVALPRRTGGYDMRDGAFRLFGPADGTNFGSHWTLYSTTEAANGATYTIAEV